jgi:hypothetical protein
MPKRPKEVPDVTRLQAENDLLTDEVRRLRARLDELERVLERRRPGERPSEREQPPPDPREEQRRRLEAQALEDMHWLVNRVDGSPLGRVLRSRAGFRTLVERYGPDPRVGR